ncbi:protein containing Adenylate cyclase domain [sediment metagenome]|uniref:Protein containing Adenylate cyclase domain n=1 Tax=sediment metagenome TaxID=749907 RepID=D9PEW8_9ZZZZ
MSERKPLCMYEIEAKIPLDEQEYTLLKNRLIHIAKPLGTVHEVNHFCDIFGFFRKTKRLLRVRAETHDGMTAYILTYKGKLEPGRFKKRREIERKISRFSAKLILLLKTGLVYEKKRVNFTVMDAVVSLDEVQKLGHFVEIEGKDEGQIKKIIKKLQITKKPVKKGYAEMMAKKTGMKKK